MPRHARHGHLGEIAAEDAREVHHQREQGHRNHQRDDPRDREVLEGVHRVRLQRVDLLGDLHRADLGADAGADAARDEQAGGQRAGLADQRNRQAGRDHCLGAKALERRARVHRQHDADRQARGQDQRCGAKAELVEVAGDLAGFVGRTTRFDEGPRAERGERTDEFEEADDAGADPVDQGNICHP